MAEVNVKDLTKYELWLLYRDWIDYSIYDGLDDDQADELMEKLEEECGATDPLRPDAPPEAVAAWEERNRRNREAARQGIIID